jgi:dephospho-CoA kinase
MLKIIILTGTDGTGKSTLKKLIEKKSNYEYIVIDRFSDSIVYDKIYNRPDREKEFLELEAKLNSVVDIYLVYVDCITNLQFKRLAEKSESEETVRNIKKAKLLFSEYLTKTPFKYIIIETVMHGASDCADKVIKWVNSNGKDSR